MSAIGNFFRRCCGGASPTNSDDDHAVPLAAGTALVGNHNTVFIEGGDTSAYFGGGDGNTGGANEMMHINHSMTTSVGGSASFNGDASFSGNKDKRRRGVSFAPDGFQPPPSPELKTSEIMSPRTRARSIIKQSSFTASILANNGGGGVNQSNGGSFSSSRNHNASATDHSNAMLRDDLL